ncbi:MAG: hypothetical protein ACQESP_11060 [Candidatus Muiribacteriota bacterium]
MKFDYNKILKNKYLSEAFQFRFCPDEKTFNDPYFKDQNQRHESICPFCKNRTSHPLAELSEEILNSEKNHSLQKGNIAGIKKELGAWKKNYYYLPPLVYINRIESEYAFCFLVSPVTELSSEKDLIAPESLTGFIPLCIETWNNLKIHLSLIESKVFDLSEYSVDIDKFTDAGVLPEWSVIPLKNKKSEEINIFRRFEKLSASYFSSSPFYTLVSSASKTAEKFLNKSSEIYNNISVSPEILIKTISEEISPKNLSASSARLKIFFYSVYVENNEVIDIQMTEAQAENDFKEGEKRIVTGNFNPIGKTAEYAGSSALALNSKGYFAKSLFSDADDDLFLFHAEFPYCAGDQIWFFNWYIV